MRPHFTVTGLFILALCTLPCCGKNSAVEELAFPVDYRSWKKPVREILDYPVPGHGAGARIIYGNDIAFNPTVTRKEKTITRVEMKEGAIVVKEVYASKKDALKKGPSPSYAILDIMYKKSGHPEAQEGWLYYIMKPGGELTRVRGRMCVECHRAANESHPYFDKNREEVFRDYLFAPFAE